MDYLRACWSCCLGFIAMSSRGDSAEKLIFSEKADEKSVKKVTCTPNNDNIISLTRLKNYMPKDSLIGPDSLSTSYYLDGTTKECRF